MEKTLAELIDLISDCNIDTISYDTSEQLWTITYKNGLDPDCVPSEDLIEFLQNA